MLLIRVLIYKVRADMIHLHLMTNTGLQVLDVTLRHSIEESEKQPGAEIEPFIRWE